MQGCLRAEKIVQLTQGKDSLYGYGVGDFVRCEVTDVSISEGVLKLGMFGEKTRENPALPFGKIATEAMPANYRYGHLDLI